MSDVIVSLENTEASYRNLTRECGHQSAVGKYTCHYLFAIPLSRGGTYNTKYTPLYAWVTLPSAIVLI